MASIRSHLLRLFTVAVLFGASAWSRTAHSETCEFSFQSTHHALGHHALGIADRIRAEWGEWVRPERLEQFLVLSLTSYRFRASNYERLQAGPAGVQMYRVGVQGFGQKDALEIPALFELLHLESLDSRPWRKFARTENGFSNTAFGFASTLESFKRVLFRGPHGEQVLELSALELLHASAADKQRLTKQFQARVSKLLRQGPVLVVALAKSSAQANAYRETFGLQSFETFLNPATGREEIILLLELAPR